MSLLFNGSIISTSETIKYNLTNDVSKVVYNGTTVWEKSNPFYIVKDGVWMQDLHWTRTKASNCTTYNQAITFKQGHKSEGTTGGLLCYYQSTDVGSSFTFVSDPIDTKGSKTLSWVGYSPDNGSSGNFGIDEEEQYYDATEGSIDVSNYSSVRLKVSQGAWAWHLPSWNPTEIKFY